MQPGNGFWAFRQSSIANRPNRVLFQDRQPFQVLFDPGQSGSDFRLNLWKEIT